MFIEINLIYTDYYHLNLPIFLFIVHTFHRIEFINDFSNFFPKYEPLLSMKMPIGLNKSNHGKGRHEVLPFFVSSIVCSIYTSRIGDCSLPQPAVKVGIACETILLSSSTSFNRLCGWYIW